MIHISADTTERRLPFWLALEEWVARSLPLADYFFSWRVNPTVIFGRNQDINLEVDLEYCRDRGIQVYRRRSGGGCVYADLDNLMISFVTPSKEITTTFAAYTNRVAGMLRTLSIPAEATGRNDITIHGKKVSGNAFYHIPGRSIVHGTMLFSTDMDNMLRAITPSRSKLESKKVASVASRITTLREYLPGMDITDFEAYLTGYFSTAEYRLTPEDIAAVEEIERAYYDLHWIFGRRGLLASPANQRRVLRRVEGVGEIDMMVCLTDGRISDIDMRGDFFLLSDLDTTLLDKIKGSQPTEPDLSNALCGVDASKTIAGLSTPTLITLITEAFTRKVSLSIKNATK